MCIRARKYCFKHCAPVGADATITTLTNSDGHGSNGKQEQRDECFHEMGSGNGLPGRMSM